VKFIDEYMGWFAVYCGMFLILGVTGCGSLSTPDLSLGTVSKDIAIGKAEIRKPDGTVILLENVNSNTNAEAFQAGIDAAYKAGLKAGASALRPSLFQN
jgi:hypothetical protein